MSWVLAILAVIAAAPFLREAARPRMGARARRDAPGSFVTLSQGVTHYRWLGARTGPVAVCVHGLTTPSPVWEAAAETLGQLGYRVLVYDLYGRGYSDRPRGTQDADFFARQLSDLLEDQGIEGAITLLGAAEQRDRAGAEPLHGKGEIRQPVVPRQRLADQAEAAHVQTRPTVRIDRRML